MDNTLKLLHVIFELELSPPFTVEIGDSNYPSIYNKHSQKIGFYAKGSNLVYINKEKSNEILKKIKQVFRINNFAINDVWVINNKLEKWLPDKFPYRVSHVIL